MTKSYLVTVNRNEGTKEKQLKLSGASFAIHHENGSANLVKGVSLGDLIGQGWLDSAPYRVFYLKQPGNKTAKK